MFPRTGELEKEKKRNSLHKLVKNKLLDTYIGEALGGSLNFFARDLSQYPNHHMSVSSLSNQ
jgi:hypothetical protein